MILIFMRVRFHFILFLLTKRRFCDIILRLIKNTERKNLKMENYISADLIVVDVAVADTISSSIAIPPDENELPTDQITRV